MGWVLTTKKEWNKELSAACRISLNLLVVIMQNNTNINDYWRALSTVLRSTYLCAENLAVGSGGAE